MPVKINQVLDEVAKKRAKFAPKETRAPTGGEYQRSWDIFNRYVTAHLSKWRGTSLSTFCKIGWVAERRAGGTTEGRPVWKPFFSLADSFCMSFKIEQTTVRPPERDLSRFDEFNSVKAVTHFTPPQSMTREVLSDNLKHIVQHIGLLASSGKQLHIDFECGRLVISDRRASFTFSSRMNALAAVHNRGAGTGRTANEDSTSMLSHMEANYHPSDDFLVADDAVTSYSFGQGGRKGPPSRGGTAGGDPRKKPNGLGSIPETMNVSSFPEATHLNQEALQRAAAEGERDRGAPFSTLPPDFLESRDREAEALGLEAAIQGGGVGILGELMESDVCGGASENFRAQHPTTSVMHPAFGGSKVAMNAMEEALDRHLTEMEIWASQALRERQEWEQAQRRMADEERREAEDRKGLFRQYAEYLQTQMEVDKLNKQRNRSTQVELKKTLEQERQATDKEFENAVTKITRQELGNMKRLELLQRQQEKQALIESWEREIRLKNVMKQIEKHPQRPTMVPVQGGNSALGALTEYPSRSASEIVSLASHGRMHQASSPSPGPGHSRHFDVNRMAPKTEGGGGPGGLNGQAPGPRPNTCASGVSRRSGPMGASTSLEMQRARLVAKAKKATGVPRTAANLRNSSLY
uniref:Uncharacterized protein n=1 Tax=Chromera velia CCMP2878 TaxID=1169474 RepID=A0A0G4H618_9ALVE|eukprot:Cvel_5760.t1-p1 / transcript=Cvel_5760.t1 / gene=Cvel_5760 / organism=Chromera_velia_CCMP2878 / gene_product=hypothetical protein / transcript_product=hypothetical protein / location=Cvel_scaffold273:88935-96329(-) / protein_length=636 / sequence_SO=supercontig / SO=protein_coding / is_pseudo=false